MGNKIGDIMVGSTGRKFKLKKIAYVKSKKLVMDGIYEHWHGWVKSSQTWTKTPSFYRLR